jgi:hypothetical protein
VPAKQKAFAVQSALLATEILPLPLVGDDEILSLEDSDESSSIRLRVIFGDKQVNTEHVLRGPSAEEMTAYRSLMSRALVVKGTRLGRQEQRIPSRAPRLGQLYDKLIERAIGYVARVPLHHKMIVVQAHLRGEEESFGGN